MYVCVPIQQRHDLAAVLYWNTICFGAADTMDGPAAPAAAGWERFSSSRNIGQCARGSITRVVVVRSLEKDAAAAEQQVNVVGRSLIVFLFLIEGDEMKMG